MISDYLEDGTLTIEVDEMTASRWYPQKLKQNKRLIKMYESSESSDVEFTVKSTTFKANKSVLFVRCKELYEIVSPYAQGEIVLITGSRPDTFKTLLEYIYTVKEPVLEDLKITKEVLEAGHKFGVTGLKLLAESTLAYKFLSVNNWADLVVFAHSHYCPLLNEQCMQVFISNKESYIESEGWGVIEQSPGLACELLKFVSTTEKMIAWDKSKVETFDVATLLMRLEEAGLDLDGSREILIDRLKEHYA